MRTVGISVDNTGLAVITGEDSLLGYVDDNESSLLSIDVSAWLPTLPAGVTFSIVVLTPANRSYVALSGASAVGGVVSHEVEGWAFELQGTVRMQIVASAPDLLQRTNVLKFRVKGSVNAGAAPTDYLPTWQAELIDNADELGARIFAFTQAVLAAEAEESARVTAENGRESAESGRVTAETGRVSAETARASAENGRVSTESARVTAETGRASAESARASSESARVTAENTRAAAEAARSVNATNLRTGGNFADTTGVIAYQITATAANNKLRLVATGTGEHWADLWAGSGLTAGHIYYARVKISGVVGVAAIEMINRLSSGSYAYSGKVLPNASGVASLTMVAASLYSTPYTSLRAELANASGSYSFTAGTEEASFEYLAVLDLTATFGAGYEPTAAQMDLCLSYWPNGWIDGTVNISVMAKVIAAVLSADHGLTPQVAALNQLILQSYDANLFNSATITSGYYINASGAPASMSGIAYSDYTNVIPGERYEWDNRSNTDAAFSLCGAYYDASKTFLAAISGTEGETIKYSTAPAGAAYIRFNIGTSNVSGAYFKHIPKTRWHGKKMVVIGDSITYGYSLSSPANQNWARLVANKLGIGTIVNYGVSGSKLAPTSDDGGASYVARYSAMDSDADLVIVFVSTNDYGSSSLVPMLAPTFGTASDRTSASYYGSLHVLFSGLLAKYIGKEILVMTPLHRTALYGATGDDYVVNPDTGKCLQDYVDAAKDVARHYGLPVLDLFAEAGEVNPNIPGIKSAYMPDGLHINFAGHIKVADRVSRRACA